MVDSQTNAANETAGVKIDNTGTVIVGGDMVGRDKVTYHTPPPQPGIFYPIPSNAFFGRVDLLQQLHKALTADRTHYKGPVALVGMSGVGKTRLAIEYAHCYCTAYSGGLYWIDATRGWEDQVVDRAELIGLREYDSNEANRRRLLRLAFSHYLNAHPGSLLILDGVNDFTAFPWCDQSTGFNFAELRCRILITTHSDAIEPRYVVIPTDNDAIGLRFEVIPVDVLPESDALELLLNSQKHRNTNDEPQAARTICAMLGYLPQAVSIAAAYLNVLQVGVSQDKLFSDYRDRLQKEGGLQVIDQSPAELQPVDYKKAVGVTLKFQWMALQNKSARFILQVMAMLGSQTPVTQAKLALLAYLPCEADSRMHVWLETLLRRIAPGRWKEADISRRVRLQIALTSLQRLSLIEESSSFGRRAENSEQETDLRSGPLDAAHKSIRLHALVEEYVRQRINTKGSEKRLRGQLELNLSHALADCPFLADRAIAVGECLLLVPDWKPPRLRKMIFERLLALMNNGAEPTLKRHQAARLLADLHWLDEPWIAFSPDTMLNYMEFFARYIDLDTEREYLEQRLSQLLDEQSHSKMGDQERAELLVFRAAMRAQLRKPLNARADYEEAWRLAGGTNTRLAARIQLGLGNIFKRGKDFRTAIDRYLEANEFARVYGKDDILQIHVLEQLAYAYALVDEQVKAQVCCKNARELVLQIGDADTRFIHLMQVLETENQVHFLRAMSLREHNDPQALEAFKKAYSIVVDEIRLFNESAIENFDYVLAHCNAGECLLEESRCSNCQTPRLLLAQQHLTHAREVARRLKITDLEQVAETLLAEVTARQREIAQGSKS